MTPFTAMRQTGCAHVLKQPNVEAEPFRRPLHDDSFGAVKEHRRQRRFPHMQAAVQIPGDWKSETLMSAGDGVGQLLAMRKRDWDGNRKNVIFYGLKMGARKKPLVVQPEHNGMLRAQVKRSDPPADIETVENPLDSARATLGENDDHVAPDVFRTAFAYGPELVANYGSDAYVCRDITVEAMGCTPLRPNARPNGKKAGTG